MIGRLPKTLLVQGKSYQIRTDYRDALRIIEAFEDPDLTAEEKVYVCLYILYEDFQTIPADALTEAYEQARWFLDGGARPKEARSKPIMDWQQDEPLIFPAVNRIAGYETRAAEYVHWWTFLGYFMEIQDGIYSHVLALRSKKNDHKKLEDWERSFWNKNKEICKLQKRLSAEEKEERERLNQLLS